MTVFAQERLADVWSDAQRLFQLHYEELTFGKERISLAPDLGKYEAMERDGGLLIFTARDEGVLIGYAAWFLVHHAHYRHNLYALNDVFFLDPARRNDPWLGPRFIRYNDRQVSAINEVDMIKWHVKVSRNFGPILRRLGYQTEEVIWSKANACLSNTDTPSGE